MPCDYASSHPASAGLPSYGQAISQTVIGHSNHVQTHLLVLTSALVCSFDLLRLYFVLSGTTCVRLRLIATALATGLAGLIFIVKLLINEAIRHVDGVYHIQHVVVFLIAIITITLIFLPLF
jgi:hypothetical protein